MRVSLRSLLLIALLVVLTGCGTPPYRYRYVRGRTATLQNGYAVAPPKAPPQVQAAIAAANRIAGLPYAYGAGHGQGVASAYDCSGAASYVLQAAGALDTPVPSRAFRKFGRKGPGRWISIYARKDHVFLVIAGLRFDTGWTGQPEGPHWTTRSRPARGTVLRHPPGL